MRLGVSGRVKVCLCGRLTVSELMSLCFCFFECVPG